jgi:acetyl esterase/lipase
MALKYDPEFFKVFEPLIPILKAAPQPAVHDIEGRRKGFEAGLTLLSEMMPFEAPDVEQAEHKFTTPAGVELSVYSFIKKGSSSTPGPAILHCHGGGMILGSVSQQAKAIAFQTQLTGVPFFSVEYRLAPESSGTNLVEDCYAGLTWLSQNASQFHVDSARIGVSGESAGGGLAAGVALMARDKGLSPPLAKQILIYPMLDDRNLIPNAQLEPFAFWKNEDNITGWTALLGADKAGKPEADVSHYCAPARAKSLAGLPSAYIDVGGLDIFRDEDIEYARRLAAEDIEIEFHLYPGVPHAFELFAPKSSIMERPMGNRIRAMQSF